MGCLIADQITKRLIGSIVTGGMKVFSFMSFIPVWNKGVSFSMFSEYSSTWIAGSTIVISLYVMYLLHMSKKMWEKVALSLILGGAMGNLIDRLFFGKVFDFISVYYNGWHFAVFNVADICISLGAFLLVLEMFGMLSQSKGKVKEKVTQ